MKPIRLLTGLALVSSLTLGVATSALADPVEVNILDSVKTRSEDSSVVAVDRFGTVWGNSRWNPMRRTNKLERHRVAANGTMKTLSDVTIRKMNPFNINNGEDGKLYMMDSTVQRFAVVTLKRKSAIKKVTFVTTGNEDVILIDATADSSGKMYVLVADGIYVLAKGAKTLDNPLRRIEASFEADDKAITVSPDGVIFVADEGAGNVYAYTSEQNGAVGPARTITINSVWAESGPKDLDVGPDGLLYVTYAQAGVASYSLTANGGSVDPFAWYSVSFADDFLSPESITLDANSHMIVGDHEGAEKIKVIALPVG